MDRDAEAKAIGAIYKIEENMDQPISPTAKTLERVLSKAGLGSRTDARSWIHDRRVTVNGVVVENPEHWVDFDTDRVELDGRIVKPLQRLYILLYKPTGFITSKGDPEGRATVYDLLKEVPSFVGTVGRLDEDTSGLLLLTNDTILAERMTNPEFHVPKKYLVKCASHLTDEQIEQLRVGIELNDGMTRSATVVRVRDSGPKTFIEITITEGRNRQVRRMIEALESKVLKLVRTELGPLKLEGLKSGNWRKLTAREVQTLYVMTKLSEPRADGVEEEDEVITAVGPEDFVQQDEEVKEAAETTDVEAVPVVRDSWNKGPKVKGAKEVSLPFDGPKDSGGEKKPSYAAPTNKGLRPPYGGARDGGDQRPRSTGSYDKGPRDFSSRPPRPPYGGAREGGDQRPRSTGSYDKGPRDSDSRPPLPAYGGYRNSGDERPRNTGSYNKGPRDYGTNGPRAPFSGPRDSGGDQRPRSFDKGPRDFDQRPPRAPYGGQRDGGDERPRNTGSYNKGPRDYGTNGPRAPFSGPRDSGGDQRPRSFDKGPRDFTSRPPRPPYGGPRDSGGDQRTRSFDKGPRDFSSRPPRPPYGGPRDSGGDQRPRSTGSFDKGPRDFGAKGPGARFGGPKPFSPFNGPKRSGPGGSSFRSKGPGGRGPRKG